MDAAALGNVDDANFEIEHEAEELWLTRKEFEEDLRRNHNQYERRIEGIRRRGEEKAEEIKSKKATNRWLIFIDVNFYRKEISYEL